MCSVQQREFLLSFMERNPLIAGFRNPVTLSVYKLVWAKLTEILNQNGPKKSWKKWSKCWANYKSKARIRANAIKKGLVYDINSTDLRIMTTLRELPPKYRISKINNGSRRTNTFTSQEKQVIENFGDALVRTKNTSNRPKTFISQEKQKTQLVSPIPMKTAKIPTISIDMLPASLQKTILYLNVQNSKDINCIPVSIVNIDDIDSGNLEGNIELQKESLEIHTKMLEVQEEMVATSKKFLEILQEIELLE